MQERRLSCKELAKAIENAIQKYNLSEAKIAKAVGCSQKSINRFRNCQSRCQDPELKKRLLLYFEALEKNSHITTILTEEDLIERAEPKLYNPQIFQEEAKVLQYYVPKAQRFIIESLKSFWIVENYEINFIAKMQQLTTDNQKKLIQKMEEYPLKIDILLPEQEGNNDMWSFKLSVYIDQLRRAQPERFKTSLDENGRNKSVLRIDCVKDFTDRCMQLQALSCQIPDNLAQIIEVCTEYSVKDWYSLILLERVRLLDQADSEAIALFETVNDHKCKIREKQIWHLLDLLSQENIT